MQLVDASDETRIGDFLRFGNRPGVTISAGFDLGELAPAKQELQCLVDAIFGPEALAVHPVVMFRFCTQQCVYKTVES